MGGTLNQDQKAEAAASGRPDTLDYFFVGKREARQEYGFDYNLLFQIASQRLGGDSAAGGALRMFGQWTVLGRGSGNSGSLVYKVENRHRIGGEIAPKQLSAELGYAGLAAVPFSNMGWGLTSLYWNQHLLGNRLALAVGIVDVTDYTDVYGLVDPWTAFSNLAFTTNPNILAPN